MSKKIFLLVLLALLFFVACGADEEAEPTATPLPAATPVEESAEDLPPTEDEIEPVTVRFAVQDVEQGRYADLINAFEEENPDVKIKLVSVEEILELDSFGAEWPDDARRRLVSAADVSSLFYTTAAAQQGLLLDLTPFIEADPHFAPEDFQPGILEYYQSSGGTWAVPTDANYMLIYYNKDAFDEAGVDYPQSGWSWEDFLATAQALTLRDGQEVNQWGLVEISSNPVLFVENRVGPLYDLAAATPAVDLEDEAVIEAFKWYTDLYQDHEVAPYFPQPDQDAGSIQVPEGYMLVEQGKAAMWPETAVSFPYRSQQMNLGVVPFPVDGAVAGASHSSRLYPGGLSISVGSSNPEAAWRWVDFLSRQTNDLLAIFGGRGTLPARQSVAEASGFWDEIDDDLGAAVRYAIDHSYFATAPQDGYSPLFDAFAAVMAGDESVESALADAQIAAEEALTAAAGPEDDAEAIVVAPGEAEEPVSDDAQTIEFMTITNPLNNQLFRDLADQFLEENPDIVVEITQPDLLGGAPTMADLAGQADCFQWFPGNFYDPETQEALLNLDPFLDADPAFDASDFYPVVLEGFSAQGQLWGLPGEITITLVEYNKDLFDQEGVAYPATDWNTEDFLSLAVDLTQVEEEPRQYGYVPNVFEAADLLVVADRLGAKLIDDSADPPATSFADPATIEAVRWFANLTTEHGVKPVLLTNPTGAAATAIQQRQTLLDEGRAAMWTNSAIQVDLGSGQERPYSTGAVPLPASSGAARGSGYQNATGYFISAGSEAPLACWQWIKFLTDQPGLGSGLPARQSVAGSSAYRQSVGDEIADAYLASMAGVTEPSFSQQLSAENSWLGYPIYWFYGAYEQILNGEASVEEALENAQQLSDAYRACMIAADDFNDELVQKNCMQGTDESLPDFLFPVSE